MRIRRIINLLAPLLAITLWVVLFIFSSRYAGPGYKTIPHVPNTKSFSFFNPAFPLLIIEGDTLLGLSSAEIDGKERCIGLWYFSLTNPELKTLMFPEGTSMDTLLSINYNDSGAIALAGLYNDTTLQIIAFDSLIHAYPKAAISGANQFKGFCWNGNKIEVVLGREQNNFGTIITLTDTSVVEKNIELPGFFDRICNIEVAYKPDKLWKFLLSTDYYRRDSVWILLGNPDKTNFLVFDENAVYPEYPGVLKCSQSSFNSKFDRSNQGFFPSSNTKDSLIYFDGTSFSFGKSSVLAECCASNKLIFSARLKGKFSWQSFGLSDSINGNIILSSINNSKSVLSFPFHCSDTTLTINRPADASETVIELQKNDLPEVMISLPSGAIFLLSHQMHFALMDSTGMLLDRKSFFHLLHTTIINTKPGSVEILDMEFPSIGALIWFALLYSMPLWWLLSLIFTWLGQQLKKKPRFSTRKKKSSIASRLIVGSLIYLLLISIFGFGLLHQLNIF